MFSPGILGTSLVDIAREYEATHGVGPLTYNPNMLAQGLLRQRPPYDPEPRGLLTQPLPMEGRLTFLPARITEQGKELALPGILAGAWNAFTAPGRAFRGDPVGPEEAMNFAGGMMMGAMPIPKPTGILGANSLSIMRGMKPDADISSLLSRAKASNSLEEFRRSVTQSHLTDLSNHDLHRFGRAIPPYKGEPYTDIVEILANGAAPGSYLTTIKYEVPNVYRAITSPGETVKIYRAVPKDAGDSIRLGDYVSLEKRYATMHGESVLGGQQGTKWKIVEAEVPKKDIVWGGADFNEWAYSPRSVRDRYPSLEDLFNETRR